MAPHVQAAICTSALMNVAAWSSVNKHVQRYIANIEKMDFQTLGPTVAGDSVVQKLVIITVGYGSGLGHMAVHAAVQQS